MSFFFVLNFFFFTIHFLYPSVYLSFPVQTALGRYSLRLQYSVNSIFKSDEDLISFDKFIPIFEV